MLQEVDSLLDKLILNSESTPQIPKESATPSAIPAVSTHMSYLLTLQWCSILTDIHESEFHSKAGYSVHVLKAPYDLHFFYIILLWKNILLLEIFIIPL